MSTWAWVRIILLAVSFLAALLGPSALTDIPAIGWYDLVAILVLSALGLLFVIGLQALNSRSAPVWNVPSWEANPFQLTQPLQFFHLGGYFALSAGIGSILRSLINEWTLQPGTFMWMVLGIGLLTGVQLCVMVFRRKIKTSEHA